jgi:N6-L-threonylcarbamoyladenine synthase
VPALPVHHLEGHLLSPLLSADPPHFPFVALLVSGGHTQLMRVAGVGQYELLGETLDDAAGEAFDKTAKLLGLATPAGPLAPAGRAGTPGASSLPRPMLHSGDLNFSFSGLKTAVLTHGRCAKASTQPARRTWRRIPGGDRRGAGGQGAGRTEGTGSSSWWSPAASVPTGPCAPLDGCRRAGAGARVFYPELELCTDNGAMIAFAGAQRLTSGKAAKAAGRFGVRPRWNLQEA